MKKILFASFLAAAAAAGLSAQTAPAPQPAQPRFRVEVNYVEVDAVVTDAGGNFVRNLQRDDFEVLEDGKPQQVTAFSVVDLPVERADVPLLAPAVVPDVRSNERAFDGRLYLIMLDDLHTAPVRTHRVRAAAKQFIERYVGANDLAAVVTTGGRSDAGQEFTSSKPLLIRAVDKFMGQKLRSSTLERLDEYNRNRELPGRDERISDPLGFERASKARNMLDVLTQVSTWMANIQGRRKSIVLFGEGIDYDIDNVFANQDASTIREDIREAVNAAMRSNVTIYSVDARGVASIFDESMEMGAPPEDPSLQLDSRGLQNELRLSQDSLRTLSDQTGGFALLNANDFRNGFERIQQDNSAYYLLGYYSSNERRDGKYRRITVRVKRPGLQVRARRGYVAPNRRAKPVENKTGLSDELAQALMSPVPASGLPMRVTAAPFKGPAPDASVLVTLELAGGALGFAQKGSTFQNSLETTVVALDQRGKARGEPATTVQLNLSEPTRAAIAARGLRLLQRLSVPPGLYTLRVAAREANGGAMGTLSYDVEVPDFYKAPLSMSGVVLTSAAAGATPTAKDDDELKELLPGPPTATREFVPADTLVAFAEVYDTQAASAHRLDISASVKADGGRTVFAQTEERSTEELQGARGGFGYRVEIPLKDMAPGSYVLTVEARSRLSGNATVRQDIPFRIRGAR